MCLYATKSSFGQVLDSKTLWEMMTVNAAKVAGFDHVLGSLEEKKLADISVFSGRRLDDPYAAAVYGQVQNVELVMRGGKILVAGGALEKMTDSRCEDVMFGAARKIVCVEEELGTSFSALETALGGVYPAILTGIPRDEPSCEPR